MVALRIPATGATRAVDSDQLSVPSRRRRERARRRIRGRIVQDCILIDATVDGSGFHSNYVEDRDAFGGGGSIHIGRQDGWIEQRMEGSILGRFVDPVHMSLRRAIQIS